MNLVIATQNFPPQLGGIEQVAKELCTALVKLGVKLTVVAPELPDAKAFDDAAPYDVVRYAAFGNREVPLAKALKAPMQSADACLCLQYTSLPGALLWRRNPSVPIATLIHGKEVLPRAGVAELAVGRLRSALLRRVDHVFAVSGYSRNRAIDAGAPSTRVQIVNPGVDSAAFEPLEPESGERLRVADRDSPEAAARNRTGGVQVPILLTVCRLVERKGIDTVLQALPPLIKTHPKLRYWVVGDGPDRSRLDRLVERHKLEAHVHFLGRVSDEKLRELYSEASLFVMMSRSIESEGDVEGFGLVLLEAQACGLPVVAAHSGGMPDALVDGVTGYLVPTGDPRALSETLRPALAEPGRLQEMRTAARAHAATSSWGKMAQTILSTLSSGKTAQ